MRLKDKSIVITGAGSGIGQAIATLFGAHGASLFLLDINKQGAQKVAEDINKQGTRAVYYQCDVSDQQQVNSVIRTISEQQSIDILVNNAGIAHVGNLEDTNEEDFERLFKVNVKGFYNCMQACITPMKKKGGGAILNLASIAATRAVADRFAYSMTKGAVVAMTFSVARDYLSHNIRCNCISPARIHTPFVDNFIRQNYPGKEKEIFEKLAKSQPIGRMGTPQEVAALALYLCSDDAAFITGMDYPIDGGFMNLNG